MPTEPYKPQFHICIFHKGPIGFWKVFQYIVHLERLDALHISSFHAVQLTDELRVASTYEGHQFVVSMGWGGATWS